MLSDKGVMIIPKQIKAKVEHVYFESEKIKLVKNEIRKIFEANKNKTPQKLQEFFSDEQLVKYRKVMLECDNKFLSAEDFDAFRTISHNKAMDLIDSREL